MCWIPVGALIAIYSCLGFRVFIKSVGCMDFGRRRCTSNAAVRSTVIKVNGRPYAPVPLGAAVVALNGKTGERAMLLN